MKTLFRSLFPLLIVLPLTQISVAQEKTPSLSEQASAAAKSVIRQLTKGSFDSVMLQCDERVKAVMNTASLEQVWKGYTSTRGVFKTDHSLGVKFYGGVIITRTMCTFANDSLNVQLVFDSSMRIAGLSFPNVKPKVIPYTSPTYADSSRFTEQEIGIGPLALPGTLTTPKGTGPFRTVILVQGSGPNDRDESIGQNKPFKDIAWGLASKGLAVLRYDKRTFAKPRFFSHGKPYTVKEEVTDDAHAAAKFLRSQKNIDTKHIYLLGHSLGAFLAPRIAEEDPKLAGIIMMASPAEPLEDLIAKQMKFLAAIDPANHKDDAAEGEKIKRGVKALTQKDYNRDTLVFYTPPSYWLDLKGYLPQKSASHLLIPMLVMQGGRDYQVPEENFLTLKSALCNKHNATLQYYKKLNHLFIEGEGQSTPAEYDKPGHIATDVIEDIVKWVKK